MTISDYDEWSAKIRSENTGNEEIMDEYRLEIINENAELSTTIPQYRKSYSTYYY